MDSCHFSDQNSLRAVFFVPDFDLSFFLYHLEKMKEEKTRVSNAVSAESINLNADGSSVLQLQTANIIYVTNVSERFLPRLRN